MCGNSAKYWKTGNLWQEVGNPILILHLNLDLLILGGQKLEKNILPLKGGRERERFEPPPNKRVACHLQKYVPCFLIVFLSFWLFSKKITFGCLK